MLTAIRNGTTCAVVTVLERAIREAAQYWDITRDPKRHDFEMWEKAGTAVHVTGPYLKLIALRKTKATPSVRLRKNCANFLRLDESQLFEAEPPYRAKLYTETLTRPLAEEVALVYDEEIPDALTEAEQEVHDLVDEAEAMLEDYRESVDITMPTLESMCKEMEAQALNFLVAASRDTDLHRKSLCLRGVGMIGEWMGMVSGG